MFHRRAVLPIGDSIYRHECSDIIRILHHAHDNGACLGLERTIVAQRSPEADLHIGQISYIQHRCSGVCIIVRCDVRTRTRCGLARKAQGIARTDIIGSRRSGLVAVDIRRRDRKAGAIRPIRHLRHRRNLRQIERLGIRQRHDSLHIEREHAPIAVLLLTKGADKSDIVGVTTQIGQIDKLLQPIHKHIFYNQAARLGCLNINGINIKDLVTLGDNDLIIKRIVTGEPVEGDGILVHIGDRHIVRDGTFRLGTHHNTINNDTTTHILATLETELIGSRHMGQVDRLLRPRLNRLRELLKQRPLALL